MEDGFIKEQGTHDELMALKGGYAAAFSLQAARYKMQFLAIILVIANSGKGENMEVKEKKKKLVKPINEKKKLVHLYNYECSGPNSSNCGNCSNCVSGCS